MSYCWQHILKFIKKHFKTLPNFFVVHGEKMIISCLIFHIMSMNKLVFAPFQFTINFLKEVMTFAFKFVLLLRLWLQFWYRQVLSNFNISNLYLIFLTLPVYNLTTCKFASTEWSQPIFDNFIQFYTVTHVVKHVGSHSANTVAFYFTLS